MLIPQVYCTQMTDSWVIKHRFSWKGGN